MRIVQHESGNTHLCITKMPIWWGDVCNTDFMCCLVDVCVGHTKILAKRISAGGVGVAHGIDRKGGLNLRLARMVARRGPHGLLCNAKPV